MSMIKLFHKIRRSLLEGNKRVTAEPPLGRLTRYLLYAMGEIVLVVIGILIALQINNWNEARKTKAFELQILQSFKDGLTQDLSDIDYNISRHRDGMRKGDIILSLLKSDQTYNLDSIARMMSDFMLPTRFMYSTSAFETLKSSGITVIENESLRNDIIAVYDSQYKFFLAYETAHVAEIERGYTEVLNTRFEDSYSFDLEHPDFRGKMKPLDFEALKSDQEFLYFLKSLRNRTHILIDFQYQKLRNKVVELSGNIEKEIDKKKPN